MPGPLVAAAQMTSGLDIAANLDTAARLIGEAGARGARVVVLPENYAFMGRSEAERRNVVEALDDGPVQEATARAARSAGTWVIAGTTPIAVDGDPRPANACLVYDDRGRRVARYDKIHLFDVDLPDGTALRESDNTLAGDEAVTTSTPFGTLGLSIATIDLFPNTGSDPMPSIRTL